MAVVIALVSQKGGVGKSTLARGLAAIVAHAGPSVRVADIDPRQHTIISWERTRRENAVTPALDVRGYASVTEALAEATDVELLIVDAPGYADRSTLEIAAAAHLVVQPTGPSLDDLEPGVLLFHELATAGIPAERLAFALCRTQNGEEEERARRYLAQTRFTTLPGALPERVAYRDAHNRGRAITETSKADLNERADALMLELMSRVAEQVKALRDGAKGKRRKNNRGTS